MPYSWNGWHSLIKMAYVLHKISFSIVYCKSRLIEMARELGLLNVPSER